MRKKVRTTKGIASGWPTVTLDASPYDSDLRYVDLINDRGEERRTINDFVIERYVDAIIALHGR